MPEIGRIQSTNFQALLTQLGITRNQIPFGLQSEVMPVVLVGGTVSFIAAPGPAYRPQDIFTAGITVAPAAGTVLADTGPLPTGLYNLDFVIYSQTDTNSFDLEWRDAANAVTIRSVRVVNSPDGPAAYQFSKRFDVATENERFRILNIAPGNVAIDYQVVIFARS